MSPHRPPYTRAQAVLALGLACAGTLAALDAHATLSCQGPYAVRVLSAWNQNPNWDAAVGQPIAAAYVEVKYMVKKTGSTLEEVAVRTNWSGNVSNWSAESNSMRFVEGPGDATGFGLQILATGAGNQYTKPGAPARGAMFQFPSATVAPNLYKPVFTNFMFVITKASDTTTSGPFGLFGDSFHWGLDQHSGGSWTQIGGLCGTGGGGVLTFDMLKLAIDGIGDVIIPPTDPVVCTINNGLDVSYPLQPVAANTMDQIGALPIGYTKQEHTISYQCTGAATTDPAYSMVLIGQKAETTNALRSTNPHVGVMVEAVDSLNGTAKVMTPNPAATAAEKVRIYNAGAVGGSSLTIRAYPVRSQAGTIDAGNFTSTGTLKIFTE